MAVLFSDVQALHSSFQWVAGPVVKVPSQEPASEGRGLKSLLYLYNWGAGVSVGRVCLDVGGGWTREKGAVQTGK